MKAEEMSKGVRATMSLSEARLIEDALTAQLALMAPETRQTSPLLDIAARLSTAADRVEDQRRTKQAAKLAERREREHRAMGQIHREVDGYHVVARMGDWIDASRDPDVSVWVSAQEADQHVQAEVRRGVWKVIVCNADTSSDFLTVGCDLTDNGSPNSIDAIARRIIQAKA